LLCCGCLRPPFPHHPHPNTRSIEAICERFGLDADATLDNIIVARAYASDQQVRSVMIVALVVVHALLIVGYVLPH